MKFDTMNAFIAGYSMMVATHRSLRSLKTHFIYLQHFVEVTKTIGRSSYIALLRSCGYVA
jgi:hypothetical protein